MQNRSQKKMSQVVLLLAKNTRVCLPVATVDKILPFMMLEAMPGSPIPIIGLMNLSGTSVPVLDLAVRLGLKRKQPYSLDAAILLCNNGGRKLAFLVDQVLGLADIDEESVQMRDRFSAETPVFLGSVPIENQLFLLLNMKLLLSEDLISVKSETMPGINAFEAEKYEHENE